MPDVLKKALLMLNCIHLDLLTMALQMSKLTGFPGTLYDLTTLMHDILPRIFLLPGRSAFQALF